MRSSGEPSTHATAAGAPCTDTAPGVCGDAYKPDDPFVAGNTKVMFSNLLTAVPHIRSGRLRALGVGDAKRNSVLPDVPTIAEAGVPGYEAANWWGVLAPAGTPAAIVDKLHQEISAAQDAAELHKQVANEGADIVKMTSAEFGAFMVREMNKWGHVVKEGGIKAE